MNTFAISGQAETKQVSEMLPSIVNQLGPEGFASLRKLAMEKVGGDAPAAEAAKDDDVPELEGDFEEASKQEEEQAKAVSFYTIWPTSLLSPELFCCFDFLNCFLDCRVSQLVGVQPQ